MHGGPRVGGDQVQSNVDAASFFDDTQLHGFLATGAPRAEISLNVTIIAKRGADRHFLCLGTSALLSYRDASPLFFYPFSSCSAPIQAGNFFRKDKGFVFPSPSADPTLSGAETRYVGRPLHTLRRQDHHAANLGPLFTPAFTPGVLHQEGLFRKDKVFPGCDAGA